MFLGFDSWTFGLVIVRVGRKSLFLVTFTSGGMRASKWPSIVIEKRKGNGDDWFLLDVIIMHFYKILLLLYLGKIREN